MPRDTLQGAQRRLRMSDRKQADLAIALRKACLDRSESEYFNEQDFTMLILVHKTKIALLICGRKTLFFTYLFSRETLQNRFLSNLKVTCNVRFSLSHFDPPQPASAL